MSEFIYDGYDHFKWENYDSSIHDTLTMEWDDEIESCEPRYYINSVKPHNCEYLPTLYLKRLQTENNRSLTQTCIWKYGYCSGSLKTYLQSKSVTAGVKDDLVFFLCDCIDVNPKWVENRLRHNMKDFLKENPEFKHPDFPRSVEWVSMSFNHIMAHIAKSADEWFEEVVAPEIPT